MKTSFKCTVHTAKGILIVAAMFPLFAVTHPASAENTAVLQNPSATLTGQVSLFCAKVDSAMTSLDQLLLDSETKYNDSKTARQESLAQTRADSDKALADARAQADTNYATQYKLLMAQATTKAQKKAVALFQKTVTQAITDRRAAVDTAIQNYRDGVDAVTALRANTFTNAVTTFKSSIDSAYSSAKADCITNATLNAQSSQAAGVTDTPAKTSATVQAAKNQFTSAITSLNKDTTVLDILASSRDQAVGNADTRFQTTVQAAGDKLKTVLGDK